MIPGNDIQRWHPSVTMISVGFPVFSGCFPCSLRFNVRGSHGQDILAVPLCHRDSGCHPDHKTKRRSTVIKTQVVTILLCIAMPQFVWSYTPSTPCLIHGKVLSAPLALTRLGLFRCLKLCNRQIVFKWTFHGSQSWTPQPSILLSWRGLTAAVRGFLHINWCIVYIIYIYYTSYIWFFLLHIGAVVTTYMYIYL